jgi:peroxiredoxin (alkyl hydroperoxide reductase subunit C)
MEIPLISDLSHEISKNLGNYIATGPDTGASLRATFIIDQNGILRHKLMNDLPVGRNIADTMATVKEL